MLKKGEDEACFRMGWGCHKWPLVGKKWGQVLQPSLPPDPGRG